MGWYLFLGAGLWTCQMGMLCSMVICPRGGVVVADVWKCLLLWDMFDVRYVVESDQMARGA